MRFGNVSKFLISVLVCQLAGAIGSLFTAPSVPVWYAVLIKPSFVPPGWVFAPVWITLFFLMGVAAFLIWKRGTGEKGVFYALLFFDIQLGLNILWSYLFFGLRFPFYAFLEIIFLWLAILITILKFYKISRIAAYLLLPYIIWVTFAAFLNFSIWQLN